MAKPDPIIGKWKLNIAKSKFTHVAAPKELTGVIREIDPEHIEIAFTGTQTDGSPISSKYTEPKQGGTVKRQGLPALPKGMTIVSIRINPNEAYAMFMLNGKQV
jgi:hypothetical protein